MSVSEIESVYDLQFESEEEKISFFESYVQFERQNKEFMENYTKIKGLLVKHVVVSIPISPEQSPDVIEAKQKKLFDICEELFCEMVVYLEQIQNFLSENQNHVTSDMISLLPYREKKLQEIKDKIQQLKETGNFYW